MNSKIKKILNYFRFLPGGIVNRIVFLSHGVSIGKSLECIGLVWIRNKGSARIGSNVRIRSGFYSNPIGSGGKTIIRIFKGGDLIIGDGVKMSNTTICCQDKIVIGDYTMLGGGVRLYDTDFHSLNPLIRMEMIDYPEVPKKKPITIGRFVFIGADTIVLKGVSIGDNSIVGAGSVVRDSIPANEIWAGNPAVKIRGLNSDEINES